MYDLQCSSEMSVTGITGVKIRMLASRQRSDEARAADVSYDSN